MGVSAVASYVGTGLTDGGEITHIHFSLFLPFM